MRKTCRWPDEAGKCNDEIRRYPISFAVGAMTVPTNGSVLFAFRTGGAWSRSPSNWIHGLDTLADTDDHPQETSESRVADINVAAQHLLVVVGQGQAANRDDEDETDAAASSSRLLRNPSIPRGEPRRLQMNGATHRRMRDPGSARRVSSGRAGAR